MSVYRRLAQLIGSAAAIAALSSSCRPPLTPSPPPLLPSPKSITLACILIGMGVVGTGLISYAVELAAEINEVHEGSKKTRICIPICHQSSQYSPLLEEGGAWNDLPMELCNEIGIRLHTRFEISCFRGVCKKWRSSLPPPTRFPLRVPSPPNCHWSGNKLAPFYITEASIAIGKWTSARLLYPCGLKPGFELEHMLGLDFLVVSKAYHLRAHKAIDGRRVLGYQPFARKMVIISSDPRNGANPVYAKASDLSVVAHLTNYGFNSYGKLALLRLGGSPENWEWDTEFCTQVVEDIATYRGRLCVLDRQGAVLVMDYDSLQMTRIAPPSDVPCNMEYKELFESHGDLYLADYASVYIKEVVAVYKLCLPKQEWIRVTDVGKVATDVLPFCLNSDRSV